MVDQSASSSAAAADGPASSTPTILTLGEACLVLDPLDPGELEIGHRYGVRVSGSEANVAVGVTRLGLAARWISRVATDPMGDLVWRTFGAEGVDLRFAHRDPGGFTGTVIKFRRDDGRVSLAHYRRGAAAWGLEPADVADAALEGVSLVHVTGITPAFGAQALATVRSVAERAAALGIPVTLDVNYRPALWSPADARTGLRALLPLATWVLCGREEARRIFDADDALAALHGAGARRVVLRAGAEGCWLSTGDGTPPRHVPPVPVDRVVDENGAGDAFDAGFITGLVLGLGAEGAAAMGNLIGARALAGTGDWETLPTRADVARELEALRVAAVAGGASW